MFVVLGKQEISYLGRLKVCFSEPSPPYSSLLLQLANFGTLNWDVLLL